MLIDHGSKFPRNICHTYFKLPREDYSIATLVEINLHYFLYHFSQILQTQRQKKIKVQFLCHQNQKSRHSLYDKQSSVYSTGLFGFPRQFRFQWLDVLDVALNFRSYKHSLSAELPRFQSIIAIYQQYDSRKVI